MLYAVTLIKKIMVRLRLIYRRMVVKVRDAFFPYWILRLHIEDGIIPYPKHDVVGWHIWEKGSFEQRERTIVKKIFQGKKVFIDIGANSGMYTLLASKYAGEDGSVLSFEASPREFNKLLLTIQWNQLKNVVAENIAIGESNEDVLLFEDQEGRGALNSIGGPALQESTYKKIRVPCVSLDTYASRSKLLGIDFIKIDVEGYELPVIKGAIESIKRYRPVILCEMNDRRRSSVSSAGQVWDFLERLSYQWYTVDEHSGNSLVPFQKPPYFETYLNLFALPGGDCI